MARERIPEHRLVGNSLRSCVEARRQLLQGLLPPPWNEPPAHRDELDPASGCGSHDFYRVGRGDVVVGLQIASRAVREFVQVLNVVPGVTLNESPAHAINLSIFSSESVPPRARDPDADDLDRSAAKLHVLKPCHCKPAFDEVSDHVAVEPMNKHKQLICSALRITGEQLQRLALVGTKARLRRGGRHHYLRLTSS